MSNDSSRQLFQTWYKSSLGESLLTVEKDELESELELAVGYYLVIQSPLRKLSLENHGLRESILIAPELELGAPSTTIICRSLELPFESDGIDVHVMHHTLDISMTPHDDLREAARTLLPSGKLVIVGFNPWSIWGVLRLFSKSGPLFRCVSKTSKAPWCGRFITHQRLEDWLKVAGLTLESKRFVYYEPPMQNGKWRRHFSCFERWLKALKLPCSGVYIMTATKQEKRYVPIRPLWKQRKVKIPPLTKPTVKEIKE